MKTMTFAMEGDIMIVLHTDKAPSEHDWTAWMNTLSKIPAQRLKLLIFTDGGAPDTLQRGGLLDHLGDAQPPIAVVSNAAAVRGVVTALSWFNPNVKLFPPARLAEAFAHLGVVGQERARALLSTAQRATAELGTVLTAFKR